MKLSADLFLQTRMPFSMACRKGLKRGVGRDGNGGNNKRVAGLCKDNPATRLQYADDKVLGV